MLTYRLAVLMCCAMLPGMAATCESLASLPLQWTTVSVATLVRSSSFTPHAEKPVENLPSFCRVAGRISPTHDSAIQFEVWMPASGWNGRFLGVGNGGFAGSIAYPSLGDALRAGYATASTDTGHHADGLHAEWALGHPEKVIDYGYRAIHETAVKAKALIHAYYGAWPLHSYFNSCSNGGRQALMEAQRYPDDYDGIIAGAPANNWTHQMAAFVWNSQALLSSPGAYIPSAKLPAIEAAALQACDAADGVKDGVIENPMRCHVNLDSLRCAGPETDACLTAAQLVTLQKLYAGPALFPGYPPGGESHAAGWKPWVTGTAPQYASIYTFGTQFFANMVFNDAAWDFRTFQVARDTKLADARLAHILNATDPGLTRFHKRGGRLILYHGWSDAAVAAPNTVNYYRAVERKMGVSETASFVRLYMVPGMQHCGSGGSGVTDFGQGGAPRGDAQHSIAQALQEWVEQGTAPGPIIATGNGRTRLLCPYPQEHDAAHSRCVAPPNQ